MAGRSVEDVTVQHKPEATVYTNVDRWLEEAERRGFTIPGVDVVRDVPGGRDVLALITVNGQIYALYLVPSLEAGKPGTLAVMQAPDEDIPNPA